MRLTVHVANALKEKVEVKKNGKPVVKEIIRNTFSFTEIQPSDVDRILKTLEDDGHGTPTKHYLSGDNFGRPIKKKK